MDINSSLEAWLFFELSMSNSLSINDNYIDQFLIIPNPVENNFVIKSNTANYNYVLYDSKGVKLIEGEESVIDMLNKPSGAYFLKIYSQDGVTTKKIIKQ